MITRICLLIPPSLFLLDERVFMSLGILKVAAVLEQEGVGVEVRCESSASSTDGAPAPPPTFKMPRDVETHSTRGKGKGE